MEKLKSHKPLLTITTIYTVLVIVISLLYYFTSSKAENKRIKEKQAFGATLVKYILPADYFDRAIDSISISPAENIANAKKLTTAARAGNFTYLYAITRVRGQYYFIACSASPEQEAKHEYDPYWQQYSMVPSSLIKVFDTGQSQLSHVKDEWGEFSSYFKREVTPKGQVYVAGADIDYKLIRKGIWLNVLRLFIGLMSLLAFMFPLLIIIKRVRASYTRELRLGWDILKDSPVGIVAAANNGDILCYNQALLKQLNLSDGFLDRSNILNSEFFSRHPLFERIIYCHDHRNSWCGEVHIVHEGGSSTCLETNIRFITYEKEKYSVCYALCQDMTAIKSSQDSLKQQSILFKYLAESSHLLLSKSDPMETIPQVLECFGQCLAKSAVQVFQQRPEGWQNIVLWNNPDFPMPIGTRFLNRHIPIYNDWLQLLRQDEYLSGKATDLPQELIDIIKIPENYLFSIYPIKIDDVLWGMLVSTYTEINNNFSIEITRDTLMSLADSIAYAVKRFKVLDSLKRATKEKTEFLSSMSHEIRTPLNGILGMISLMKTMDMDSEQKEYIDAIQAAGNQLFNLISDLLDITRIEAGKVTLHKKPLNIIQIIESAVNIVKQQAKERKLELKTNLSKNLPTVIIADDTRLKQIIVNLLNNSIKFTPSGFVSLSADLIEHDTLQFIVQDTGVGMTEEQIKNIFEPFYQAGNEASRSKGSGLGLAITNKLVNLMNGEIKVNSTPGKGTIFDVRVKVITFEPSGSSDL